MKKNTNSTNSVKTLERDLKIASSILEWEMGDMWGHVGARLPDGKGIMVKSIRPASGEDERKDWLVPWARARQCSSKPMASSLPAKASTRLA